MKLSRFACALFIIAALAGSSCAELAAPAGTKLESRSEVLFGSERYLSKPVAVRVPQIFGLNLSPKNVDLKVSPGEVSYTSCQLDNLGNGTDRVSLDFSGGRTDLRVRLVVDENKDGVHQAEESKTVPGTLSISEGSAYNFFIEISSPPDIRKGSWTWGALNIMSSGSDGPAYVGYNGGRYGGEDSVTTNISVSVE